MTVSRDRSSLTPVLLLPFLLLSGCSLFQSSPEIDTASIVQSQGSLALRKAEAAEQSGKLEEAIRYYEQAYAFDPGQTDLSRRLAVLYDLNGQDSYAHTAYERALKLEPNDPDLLNDYGVFYQHREDWTNAETWFRRSLEQNPDQPRVLNNLAMCLAMQNRLAESHAMFEQVVGPAAAYSNLGVLLARQGRLLEAQDHFHRALALDRSLRPAQAFLGEINTAIARR